MMLVKPLLLLVSSYTVPDYIILKKWSLRMLQCFLSLNDVLSFDWSVVDLGPAGL